MISDMELAGILHYFFCPHEHEEDMNQIGSTEKCCWLLEQELEDVWAQPDHATWLVLAEPIGEAMRQQSVTKEDLASFLRLRAKSRTVFDLLNHLENRLREV